MQELTGIVLDSIDHHILFWYFFILRHTSLLRSMGHFFLSFIFLKTFNTNFQKAYSQSQRRLQSLRGVTLLILPRPGGPWLASMNYIFSPSYPFGSSPGMTKLMTQNVPWATTLKLLSSIAVKLFTLWLSALTWISLKAYLVVTMTLFLCLTTLLSKVLMWLAKRFVTHILMVRCCFCLLLRSSVWIWNDSNLLGLQSNGTDFLGRCLFSW